MKGRAVTDIEIRRIVKGKYQPRKQMGLVPLENLTTSIKAYGILEPLIVRRSQGSDFELVAGERRLLAAEQAGLDRVPCLIFEFTDDQAAEVTLVENLQRESLSPIECAVGIRCLIDKFGHTQESIAGHLGMAQSSIAHLLRLLSLPADVVRMIDNRILSVGHGKVLLQLQDPSVQVEAAKTAVRERWSVRQLEASVREAVQTGARSGAVRQPTSNCDSATNGVREATNGAVQTVQRDISRQLKIPNKPLDHALKVSVVQDEHSAGYYKIFFRSRREKDVVKSLIRKLVAEIHSEVPSSSRKNG